MGRMQKFLGVLRSAGMPDRFLHEVVNNSEFREELVAWVDSQPAFRLIHGRFTPLADKVEMVKSWPGINPADVDVAVALAHENGTIAGFEAESPDNPLLDLVIVVYRESLPATLLYGRARFMEAFEGRYVEWREAYASGVDDKRIELIPGAREFRPNTIEVQAVDFGANWDRQHGNVLRDVQRAQAGQLEDFAALFNASQSPKWVEQMDGKTVPYTILAALLLSVPGYDARSNSPYVWHDGDEAELSGDHVDDRFRGHSMAVIRKYKS